MIRFFRQKNTYSSSIEGSAVFLLRIAYSCWGVTHPFWPRQKPVSQYKWWEWLLFKITPMLAIIINNHTGQNGRVTLFKFLLFGYGISYITKGEDSGHTNRTGLSLGWTGRI